MASEFFKKLKLSIDAKESIKEIAKDFTTKIDTSFKSVIKSITSLFTDSITNAFTNAYKSLESMVNQSTLLNPQTRETVLSYGVSTSEAYGLNRALSTMGINNIDELAYANQSQVELFNEFYEKFTSYYDEIQQSGLIDQMREYQYEMIMFKTEIEGELMKFIADNKDLIKSALQAIMWIAQGIVTIISWLGNLFRRNDTSVASTSDVISQYNQTNSSNSTSNVNVNNTFNGVSAKDEAELANFGAMTYEQVIKALGGD